MTEDINNQKDENDDQEVQDELEAEDKAEENEGLNFNPEEDREILEIVVNLSAIY